MSLAEANGENDLFEASDDEALKNLFTEVYGELRRLAAHHLKNERPNHTLRPTELVHEVYLQLRKQHSLNLNDRAYFLSIASTMMRRILVNYAKRRLRKKREAQFSLVTLDDQTLVQFNQDIFDVLELEAALNELAKRDLQAEKIVEMYFYGGLTFAEIADVLGVSLRTVMRDWRFARSWLYQKLKRSD